MSFGLDSSASAPSKLKPEACCLANAVVESDVRAPLLQGATDSTNTEKYTYSTQKETGTPKDFDQRHNALCDAVTNAWKLILDLTRKMLCRVAALLAVIFPFKQQALTEKQEERLRALWYRCQIPFDSSKEEHVEALEQLWHAAFPDTPWTGQKSRRWTEMGWQGMDPATDFRGGGFLALECLLDLHRIDPVLFGKLLTKSDGVRADWEYPFAVAGVNLTFALTEMLQLRKPANSSSAHARGFLKLLEIEENAFSHVFCIMFALLDKIWLETAASYMEFSLVLKGASRQLEEALGSQPRNLNELRKLLGL